MRQLDDRSFWRTLEDEPGPALVLLSAAGCGACRRVKALLAELAPAAGVPVWALDAHDSPGVVAELEVFHLPALFGAAAGELSPPLHAPTTREGLAGLLAQVRDRAWSSPTADP